MAISADYDAISQDLTVTGDGADNAITVSRNAGGTLLVNNGAVSITGGPATVANTDLIVVSGDLGNDTISLDETNGALPAAELAGGGGNDALTAGSGADSLFGEAGDDILLGRGGADILQGGGDNDTLAGGDGDDQMFGGDGNDRMIWNPGDDTDLMEGGLGSDTAEVNGSGGDEVFTITANGTRVRFDRLSPAPFALDIGTTESLVLYAGGGNDSISSTGALSTLIALTLDGGGGDDTILGSNGADVLLGGDGNDFVDGQQGNDVAFLGAGSDVFQWDPGDGSDVIEGQADNDTLLFNGSGANEILTISANGARVLFTRDVGNIVMDVNDLETFTINALGGIDTFTVNDLAGTDATGIALNLAGTIGGATGDGLADTLFVNGSNTANAIGVTGSGTGFSVSGLAASIAVTNSEGANDVLVVNALGGDDNITATTLAAGVVKLTIDGGAGSDTIQASQGADTILGGDGNDSVFGDNGNDTAFLGAGNDVFQWAPGDGNDIIEGQADVDELQFTGSNATENINIAPNGGRILFTRDIAAVTMDLDDVEQIRFDALGGADNIVVGDLTGTDATKVELHLTASGGGGDGAVDTVTVNSTNVADVLAAASSNSVVYVSGLPWTVSISGAEGANDRLTLNGAGGDDVINASGLAAGLVSLTVNGGLGTDVVIGSAGGDIVNGGDGNDTALLGAGNDIFVWNPGDDNDTIEGQSGTDTLRFNGSNIAENITISPNGGRVIFFRDVASVTMDLNDTEVIQYAAVGGADNIVVNDLSGTDVTQLAIDLAAFAGGAAGDAAIDALTLNASDSASTIVVSGATGALLTVTGLPASVTISQFETSGVVDHLTILALGGNDDISATGLVPHLGTLTIDGGSGNDIIRSNGDGTYLGGIGDDVIFAGLTNALEALDGGAGIDTLDTTSFGGVYTINLVTGVTNYSGEAFTNFENLVTGAGADTVTGTAGANTISTNAGVDFVDAAAGNDTVSGGAAGDTLDGGADFDMLDYRTSAGAVTVNLGTNSASGGDAAGDIISNFEGVYGSASPDALTGSGGNNVLDGGGGGDAMAGGAGDDVYIVDSASDTITELAGGGLDTVLTSVSFTLASQVERLATSAPGSSAGLSLTGNALANEISGNAGANLIDGGAGADLMSGAGGDDIYFVDNAGDIVSEGPGAGYDTVFSTVSYTISSLVERLVAFDPNGTAALNFTGSSVANEVSGNNGANVIDGGGGADILTGYAGGDAFVFSTSLGGGNVDTLVDFAPGIDRIYLDDAVFGGLAGGTLAAGAFVTGAAAADASDRIIYDPATGALYFDADGNGAGAAIQFAAVSNGLALAASDFAVI